MKAKVYPEGSLGPVFVEVTPGDVARGYVHRECPSCEGDGIVTWLPHRDEADCIECSTRGEVGVSV